MSHPRGRPFERGNHFSRGRPRGSRNKSTQALQKMLGAYAEPVIAKCISAALEGDRSAMRLCMERILPPIKYSPVQLRLPRVKNAVGVGSAMERLVQGVANGEIPPEQAEMMAKVLEIRASRLQEEDVERHVDRLFPSLAIK